jgi:hypothetical protein
MKLRYEEYNLLRCNTVARYKSVVSEEHTASIFSVEQ